MKKTLHDDAIEKLSNFIKTLSFSDDMHKQKQADLLSYWIKDYITMLSLEDNFEPAKNIVYHRGDIIKAHFGYRIGSEHGGLHYAVVIDDNKHNSPVITVVPLVSLKPGVAPSAIHPSNVYLGNEIFKKLSLKCVIMQNNLLHELSSAISGDALLHTKVIRFINSHKNASGDKFIRVPNSFILELENSSEKLNGVSEKLAILNKIYAEIFKMKQGSIAVVNQITTISKIRIYDPRKTADVLSGISLSTVNLDLINNKLKELFIHE